MRSLVKLSALTLFLMLTSCWNQEVKKEHDDMHEKAAILTSSTGYFGEIIVADNAVFASELPLLLENKEKVHAKLTGKIDAVCQMSGCWMDISISDGETVHITFKDDAFVIPKDASGKTAIFEGIGTYEEIPVDMLKHMAEDEGKSQDEIDAIIEPKMEYTFIANGVIIEDK